MIEFIVFGTPQPQGSTRAFIPRGWKRPIITSDNPKLKPWRQEVAAIAAAHMAECGDIIVRPNPVLVQAQFFFARPKSVKNNIHFKTTRPDSDKILRGLLDALTGICYEDDSQVASLQVTKMFDASPRMVVRVAAIVN